MTRNTARINPTLRERLLEITDVVVAMQIGEQVRLIEELKTEFEHSVSLAQEAIPLQPATWRFNCHAYAFRLNTTESFWRLDQEKPNVWPTGEFVSDFLLPILRRRESVPQDEDIAVFFEGEEVKHSGVVRGNRVRSKWGTGHVWDHGTFETPPSFGSVVSYFHPIEVARVVEAYVEFAKGIK